MIGINYLGSSNHIEAFVAHFGITFTILRDLPVPRATRYYGIRYWSEFWLLDEQGDRVGDRRYLFSVSRVEQLLAELGAPAS